MVKGVSVCGEPSVRDALSEAALCCGVKRKVRNGLGVVCGLRSASACACLCLSVCRDVWRWVGRGGRGVVVCVRESCANICVDIRAFEQIACAEHRGKI